MRKFFITIALFVFINATGYSQFFNYLKANAVNAGNLVYNDLGTSGTVITTNFKNKPMTFDDDNSAVRNIGFTFSFAGNNFTQFVLNTNGFIKLGNDTTAIAHSFDVLDSASTSATNVIYALNTDLKPTVNTEYRVYTTGTIGSRTCTIQFKGIMDNGYALASPPTDVQFDYIEFQIILFEGSNNVEFVYGNFTANLNTPGFISTNCGLKSIDPAHSVNATKSSQTVFTGATFLDGAYTGNAFNVRNNFLPNPGFTLRFVPITIHNNNVSVGTFYSMGKLPKNYDHSISAIVHNIGNTSYTNFPVTLDISGANTFTNTQTIPSLASGEKKLVTFSNFTSPNNGVNNVKISVSNDNDTANDYKKFTQTISNTTMGYGIGTGFNGSIGQSTSSIDFATRFANPIANTITSISLYFDTVRTYSVRVFGVSADTPKTTLYNSGNKPSVVGLNTITPATPISVTGDFFIVITQPSTTTSLRYLYQTEDPIREKTFFFRTPSAATGSKWNDFAPNNSFRLLGDVTMGSTFLPIKLKRFIAYPKNKTNILEWGAVDEINNLGYEIQRSNDGNEFSKIGFVESKNNSTTSNNIDNLYSFNDINPLKGNNYYRLRQLDKDGSINYSNIVSVKTTYNSEVEIVNIYPNPARNNINLAITGKTEETYIIKIIDMLGKSEIQKIVELNTGDNKITINTDKLSTGTYTIQVVDKVGNLINQNKFIKL